MLVAYAAFSDHCSFFPLSGAALVVCTTNGKPWKSRFRSSPHNFLFLTML